MFNSRTKDVVENSLKLAKFAEERQRMRTASMERDYYNNDQMDYVYSEIAKLRVDASSKKYATYVPLTNNIIDEVSVMFSSGYSYELKYGDNISDDVVNDNNAILSTITKDANLTSVLSDINIYTNLNGTAGALVEFNNDTRTVEIRLVTKDMFFVEQSDNDPNKIEAVYIYLNPFESTPNKVTFNGIYTKITAEYIMECEVNMSNGKIKNLYNTQQENPLGFIPFVLFNKQTPINSIYSSVKNPLPELNLQINLEISRLNWIEEFQAFSPLVLINGDKDSISYGANKVIMLNDRDGNGQSMDAKFISPNVSFTELDNLIVNHMVRAGQLMGVGSSAYKDSATFSSGYQLRLSKEDVVRLNRKQKPLYIKSMKEMYDMMIFVNNMFGDEKINNEYNELVIEINDPEFDVSNQEKEESYSRRIALGLTSQVRILSDELDISEEDAETLYRKILEQNNIGKVSAENILNTISNFEA